MKLTEQQKQEYKKVVEPVIKWLNDNCHPHMSIEIDSVYGELKEGQLSHHTKKFLHDTLEKVECPTCGLIKESQPNPDGDEICPDCGEREMKCIN